MNLKTMIILTAAFTGIPIAAAPPATVPATQSAESKAEQWFHDGSDALFKGNYPKAIELLEKASEWDNTKTSFRVHLARAYRYSGREKDAAALLEGVLKTTPDHVEAGQLLGELLAQQENWKRLVEVLEPLLKYRHDYSTYHMLADAKYNLDDIKTARRLYEEAIKLNPSSAADHYALGNIYLAGNFFALAADSYQSSVSLGMQSPVLHYKLASAYFNLRNYFGAVSVVSVKAGKPGTISGDWYLIEPVPGEEGRFRCAPANSAIYQVARAIADGIGERPDIRFLMANIHLNAGRYAQAYERFKEIEPTIPKEDKSLFYFYDAQAAFGVGDYEQYLNLLQQAIKLDPAAYGAMLVDAYIKVADQYNQAGKLDQYINYLNLAVQQSPQTASLHLQLGNAYQEAQKYPQAVIQWKMVLDLEPEHPKRLDLLNTISKFSKATTQPATKA